MWLLLAGLAWGQDACPTPPARGDAFSVAWVAPLHRRARGWLSVVPTAELAAAPTAGSVARTLQLLGQRSSSKEPKRRYKIVIFDVAATDLCRPGPGAAGVGACEVPPLPEEGEGPPPCPYTLDLATNPPRAGLEEFRARWPELADEGFCLLPLGRFLGGR